MLDGNDFGETKTSPKGGSHIISYLGGNLCTRNHQGKTLSPVKRWPFSREVLTYVGISSPSFKFLKILIIVIELTKGENNEVEVALLFEVAPT